MKDQNAAAKKAGKTLPKVLLSSKGNQCRREGATYALQCLDCALEDRGSYYQGETSKSTRQRQGQHQRDLEQGVASSPLVVHALQEHGGKRPNILHVIKSIEPRPLYRAIRESVAISCQQGDPGDMNRCQEWGAPRVPILKVSGGTQNPQQLGQGDNLGTEILLLSGQVECWKK